MNTKKCSICNDRVDNLLVACHNCKHTLLPLCIFCIEDTSCPFCDFQLSFEPSTYISPNFFECEERPCETIFDTDEKKEEMFFENDFVDENEDPTKFCVPDMLQNEEYDSEVVDLADKKLDMNNVFESERNKLFERMDMTGRDGCDMAGDVNNVTDSLICMDDEELKDAVNECIIEIENEIKAVSNSVKEDDKYENMECSSPKEEDSREMQQSTVGIDDCDLAERKPFEKCCDTRIFISYKPNELERDPSFIKQIGSINQLTGEPSKDDLQVEEKRPIHIEKGYAMTNDNKCEDKKVSGLVAFFEQQMKK